MRLLRNENRVCACKESDSIAVAKNHAERRVHGEIRECTTQHGILVVVGHPFQVRNGDNQTLHEGDRQRVGIHEHCCSHDEALLR